MLFLQRPKHSCSSGSMSEVELGLGLGLGEGVTMGVGSCPPAEEGPVLVVLVELELLGLVVLVVLVELEMLVMVMVPLLKRPGAVALSTMPPAAQQDTPSRTAVTAAAGLAALAERRETYESATAAGLAMIEVVLRWMHSSQPSRQFPTSTLAHQCRLRKLHHYVNTVRPSATGSCTLQKHNTTRTGTR